MRVYPKQHSDLLLLVPCIFQTRMQCGHQGQDIML
ncbi:hypothetical protein GDO78_012038 [Eleutherodactylus coqui]|uniref:Uncharacterized protein n=1 Tax=Eleutherodactylus coqui TaxID=57060 RepID=A0A8J6F570_ELECQ|nr:hypothetical protein GDO78_012038 [Eleutherodactylus coqui]